MNGSRRARSSVMFLTELMFAILFFAICSAICVHIFVKSHILTQEASETEYALSACDSAAELAASADDLFEVIELFKTAYPLLESTAYDEAGNDITAGDAAENETELLIFYDGSGQACGRENAQYVQEIFLSYDADKGSETGGMVTILQNFKENADDGALKDEDGGIIFTLETKHYLKEGAGL